MTLISCNQNNSKTKNTIDVAENTITKNNLELKALADSLELTENEYNDLLMKHKKTEQRNSLYYRKIHLLQLELDSTRTKINTLQNTINRYENVTAPSISDNEQDIVLLVHHMHASWKRMPKTKDPNEILQYFLPAYIVNLVAIDGENKGEVAAYNNRNYKNYLKEIINRDGFSYEFGDVHFLDIEIKDRLIYNIVYKCVLRSYKNDVQQSAKAVIVTITGKKQNEKWKVANYSIVSFQYQTLMNITL